MSKVKKPKLTSEERSKIAKRSKDRGGTFERKIAKLFTEAVTDTPVETVWHKTPASGGMRWKKRDDVIGDIVCDRPDFIFTVECKKHEDIDMEVLFYKRKSNTSSDLISFYEQACNEAIRAGKQPMLVVERKRGKPYMVIPRTIFRSIMDVDLPIDHVIHAVIRVNKEYDRGWENVALLPVKEFLQFVLLDKLFTGEQ
jgi:hypothetical protein